MAHCTLLRLLAVSPFLVLPAAPVWAADDYQLQVVAHSVEYPTDPAAQLRTFWHPQLNENGQVLFGASWNDARGGNLRVYLGRPGALAPVLTSKQPAPALPGYEFSSIGPMVFNAEGELLINASLMATPQPGMTSLGSISSIWRGKPATMSLVGSSHIGPPIPPLSIANFTYNGRIGFQALSHRLSDNSTGYLVGSIVSEEGPVISDGAFRAGNPTRVIWYKDGPAPGIEGDYVFAETRPPVVAQKNGNLVAQLVVRPRGNTDIASFRTVFYEGWSDEVKPFYKTGDPLPGLPPLAEFLPALRGDNQYVLAVRGADIVDYTGNTYLEATANDSFGTPRAPLGLWKKLSTGLVPGARYNQDYAVSAGTVRLTGLQGATTRIAMGNGKLAFVTNFNRDGNIAGRGLFRETETGIELLAFTGMTVPGTTQQIRGVGDFSAIAMNERGDLLFTDGIPSLPRDRTVWLVDARGVYHRIIYNGQVFTIGGMNRTVLDFVLASDDVLFQHTYSRVTLNNLGMVLFVVTFTDNTKAIVRAVPPGYEDPPLEPTGPDYWFNGRTGNNWHTSPPTNWENYAKVPSSQAPGDADPNSARVFVLPQYSVMLNQRAASIGSLRSEGQLTLQQALTLNFPSEMKTLTATAPNGALHLRNSNTNVETTHWLGGTMSLANSAFRNRGRFNATTGSITAKEGAVAFENEGHFEKVGTGNFGVEVPFRANSSVGTPVLRVAAGRLDLAGGGNLAGNQTLSVNRSGTLALAGRYKISGNLTFEPGDGDVPGALLEVGTQLRDATLELDRGARVDLRLKGDAQKTPGTAQAATFNGGEIGGNSATFTNHGTVVWRGGDISLKGSPGIDGFINHGSLEIAEGPSKRRIRGDFTNRSEIVQRASIELDGTVVNQGQWRITRAADIRSPSGDGEFGNGGTLAIKLEESGVVNFDLLFSQLSPFVIPLESTGRLIVGQERPVSTTAPTSTVRLLRLGGVVTEGELPYGEWTALRGGEIKMPVPVTTIAKGARVILRDGGSIGPLQLRTLSGAFTLENTKLTLTEGFNNMGNLTVVDKAELTIQGNVTNNYAPPSAFAPLVRGGAGKIVIGSGSKVFIDGDLNAISGSLILHGELEVNGVADIGNGGELKGRLTSKNSVISFHDETHVGSSPGTLIVDGSVAFTSTAALNMEIGGTQLEKIDLLDATGTLALGGRLRLSAIDNFEPAASDRFVIVRAAVLAGAFANVASGQRVITTDGRGSFQVFYGPGSPHGETQVVATSWQPAPAGSPLVAEQPRTQAVTAGDRVSLTVRASGNGPLSYQWQYRGVNIPGANTSSYTLPSAQPVNAGSYSVVVTNALGSVSTSPATLTIDAAGRSASRLRNVSTRALIRDGNEPLIPGFVVQGTSNARFLIRAVGPTLNQFGVPDALPNPQLTLKRLAGSSYVDFSANRDWNLNTNAVDVAAATAAAGAFPLPTGSLDSALLVDVPAGQYTVVAGDEANRSGVTIVEVYDLTAANSPARLSNISTRAYVGAGADIVIPGFVVSPEGPRTVLVRAVGPTLEAFGVTGVLADPQLTLVQRQPDGSDLAVLSNNDWSSGSDAAGVADTAAAIGAFALPAGSRDAALIATLSPGAYTVQVSGVAGTTGNALVELYVVP
jgi:hypothetical protein